MAQNQGSQRLVSFLPMLLLSACATAAHNDVVYSIVEPRVVDYGGEVFVIRDRPDLQRLVVTGDVAHVVSGQLKMAVAIGLVNFGGVVRDGAEYVGVMMAYFSSSNRNCWIVSGHATIAPEWEFAYQCDTRVGILSGRGR